MNEKTKLNLMVYGEPGSGKTWFAASFAIHEDFKPCLYIDCGGQTISLRNWNKEEFSPTFVGPRTMADLKRLLGLLQSREAFVNSELGRKMGGYPKLIIVDTMSEVQRIFSDSITGIEGKVLGVGQLKQKDYGTLNSYTLSFIRSLNDLDTHTIYTYWSYRRVTETGVEPYMPQLLGSSREMVLAYANYVGFLISDEQLDANQRRLLKLRPNSGVERLLIHSNNRLNKGKNQLFDSKIPFIANPEASHFINKK